MTSSEIRDLMALIQDFGEKTKIAEMERAQGAAEVTLSLLSLVESQVGKASGEVQVIANGLLRPTLESFKAKLPFFEGEKLKAKAKAEMANRICQQILKPLLLDALKKEANPPTHPGPGIKEERNATDPG